MNVVAIGAGWATRERHVPALLRDPRVNLLGVVDTHPERAAAVAKRYGLANSGASLEEGWASTAEAVTIGTPPVEHADGIADALERGLHCLSEKPFVLPSSRASALIEAAEKKNLVLAVVHNFQFSRGGSRLFELIETGGLGRLEAVYGFQLSNHRRRLPHWYRDLPGGLFLDEAPHLLYLMRRALGGRLEVRSADARLHENEIRDLSATFEHDETWGSLTMNFNSSISEWQFVVVGDDGVAALDVFRDILITLPNDQMHLARNILRSSAGMVGGHAVGFFSSGFKLARHRLLYGNDEVIARYVDAIEGRRDRLDWISGADGQAVVAGLEAILGRVGVNFPT